MQKGLKMSLAFKGVLKIKNEPLNQDELSIQEDENDLCDECRRIAFETAARLNPSEARFFVDDFANDCVVAQLGTRCNSPPNNGCSLCEQLYRMREPLLKPDSKPDFAHIRARSFLHTTFFNFLGSPRQDVRDRICLTVEPSKVFLDAHGRAKIEQCLLLDRDDAEEPTFRSRDLQANINMDIVREWLEFCRTHHRKCQIEAQPIFAMNLIDCNTQNVVPAPPNATYVALSYVWGKVQSQHPGGEYGLGCQPNFSKTIRDAISVTVALGIRYLWVDRYCIAQHNIQEKHNQIRQMDLIYGQAFVTIIAASGSDAEAGLAGVGSTTREIFSPIRTGKLQIRSTLVHPHSLITRSIWASRGWTLQEAKLSPRRLVFTEEQVYFECKRMRCQESIDIPLVILLQGPDNLGSRSAERRDFMYPGLWSGEPNHFRKFSFRFDLREYWSLAIEYSWRQLSYDEDCLTAFTGIIRDMETGSFGGVKQIVGLPYSEHGFETADDSFIAGLAWYHEIVDDSERVRSSEQPGRRSNFPSWSWAGWKGSIDMLDVHDWDPTIVVSDIKFEYEGPQIVPLETVSQQVVDRDTDYTHPQALILTTEVIDSDEIKLQTFDSIEELSIAGMPASYHPSETSCDLARIVTAVHAGQCLVVVLCQWFAKRIRPPDCLRVSFLVVRDQGEFFTRVGVIFAYPIFAYPGDGWHFNIKRVRTSRRPIRLM
jgi:hypothetical protein